MSTLEMASTRLPYTNIFLLHAYHKNHEMTLGYATYNNKNIIRSNDKYPQFKNCLNQLLKLLQLLQDSTFLQWCCILSSVNYRTFSNKDRFSYFNELLCAFSIHA